MKLSGWGGYPPQDCTVLRPRDEQALRKAVSAGPVIARGNGRSYGDSAVSLPGTLDMRGFNRILGFDAESGQVVAEAGVMLDDILRVFLPRGWFPRVTPGTRYVTLGGMIAADVHGKNHHVDGAFGDWVDWIDLVDADGATLRCSLSEKAELFNATIGGMGLTGVILRAAFRLRPVESGWIRQHNIVTPDLETTLAAFERHAAATYSVAWIDCLAQGAALGRSILTLGEHARVAELAPERQSRPFDLPARRTLSVPCNAPNLALNRWSVKAFNHVYYRRGQAAPVDTLVRWDSYFYPLDALLNWNRIYGRRGFVQYQCVLPLASSPVGLTRLLEQISASGMGSFLAVLKRMGPGGAGALSFPMEGYTLALDFPAAPQAMALLRRLDEIVIAHGGRFYLAKDSRLTPEVLRRADPRSTRFQAMRDQSGLNRHFSSSQSERLFL